MNSNARRWLLLTLLVLVAGTAWLSSRIPLLLIQLSLIMILPELLHVQRTWQRQAPDQARTFRQSLGQLLSVVLILAGSAHLFLRRAADGSQLPPAPWASWLLVVLGVAGAFHLGLRQAVRRPPLRRWLILVWLALAFLELAGAGQLQPDKMRDVLPGGWPWSLLGLLTAGVALSLCLEWRKGRNRQTPPPQPLPPVKLVGLPRLKMALLLVPYLGFTVGLALVLLFQDQSPPVLGVAAFLLLAGLGLGGQLLLHLLTDKPVLRLDATGVEWNHVLGRTKRIPWSQILAVEESPLSQPGACLRLREPERHVSRWALALGGLRLFGTTRDQVMILSPYLSLDEGELLGWLRAFHQQHGRVESAASTSRGEKRA